MLMSIILSYATLLNPPSTVCKCHCNLFHLKARIYNIVSLPIATNLCALALEASKPLFYVISYV